MRNKFLSPALILVFLLFLGGVVRLYRFNGPIADWHSWRQADTSAVSRNFVKHGYDLLHPRFDDISNVPSGLDNPNGYRFVEFPIYNLAQAGLFQLFGHFTLEEWGRIVTIFSSLLTALFLYLIVKRHTDWLAGFLAAFFFLFLPYDIYYGRVILPDPSMIMAVFGAIYFFDSWLRELDQKKSPAKAIGLFTASVLFSILSLLLKPYAIFFLLPIAYLAWEKWELRVLLKWPLWLFLILSVTPLALWRIWMLQYPEGIAASSWLFNKGNIRFTGAYFYWIFSDRLGRLIFGNWGIGLFILGLLYNFREKKTWKEMLFFATFLISSLAYVVIIAAGNVQHDYYQILIIPSLAIFLGLGGKYLLTWSGEWSRKLVGVGVFLFCTLLSLMIGWYFVRDYFNINNPTIVEVGKIVDAKTPPDAKVIALYDGDTTFLYQTNRQGWASYEKSLPELIGMGADYLAQVHPTPSDVASLSQQYQVIASSSAYLVVKLQ